MKICVHRGTQQIGGTCIEVESQGKRIALDVGLPLDSEDEDGERLLPPVPGFLESDDSLLGVAVSHPHKDRFGLAKYIRTEIPVSIGASANRILKAASRYVPGYNYFSNAINLKNNQKIELGPFNIIPFLVDHSAFDA